MEHNNYGYKFTTQKDKSAFNIFLFQALIDAHDQIGAIWLDRGSGIDEKDTSSDTAGNTDKELDLDLDGEMPVETIKVVGLRKVPGQPLGLTVSCKLISYKSYKNV